MRLVKAPDNEMVDALWEECQRESGYDPFGGSDTMSWYLYDGDQVVGVVGASAFDWISRRCRGATYIIPNRRKEGLGALAIRMRNELLKRTYNLRRVEATIYEDNPAAQAMARKAGGTCEATLPDLVYFNGNYRGVTLWAWRMD